MATIKPSRNKPRGLKMLLLVSQLAVLISQNFKKAFNQVRGFYNSDALIMELNNRFAFQNQFG